MKMELKDIEVEVRYEAKLYVEGKMIGIVSIYGGGRENGFAGNMGAYKRLAAHFEAAGSSIEEECIKFLERKA